MMKRIGVIGIVIEDLDCISNVNSIISSYNDIIVGRLGIPYKEKGVSVISLVVDGTTDDIGSLTGKLGSIKGINVKSALTKQLSNRRKENEE
ncbi:MAG: CopG family transcriptional regulator [Tissierellales bacterium]|nr:CopG family transcriptional regulator [Tissierellales bacterium]HCX03424.1 CopG family transcriptional regulator [Clostridiales bacterium]